MYLMPKYWKGHNIVREPALVIMHIKPGQHRTLHNHSGPEKSIMMPMSPIMLLSNSIVSFFLERTGQ